MKSFILIMHLMIWDKEFEMWRGVTFFEPEIPKYQSARDCNQAGYRTISKVIRQLQQNKIKTGKWEFDCLEVEKSI